MDRKMSLTGRPKRTATNPIMNRQDNPPAIRQHPRQTESSLPVVTSTSRRNDELRAKQRARLSIKHETGIDADKSCEAFGDSSLLCRTTRSPTKSKSHRKLLRPDPKLSKSLPVSPADKIEHDPIVAYQALLAEREKQLARLLTRIAPEEEVAKFEHEERQRTMPDTTESDTGAVLTLGVLS